MGEGGEEESKITLWKKKESNLRKKANQMKKANNGNRNDKTK